MNEQIRKLMLESDCISLNISNKMERFAQLIVQECIGIADEYDGVGSTIVSRIEKHFGVEE